MPRDPANDLWGGVDPDIRESRRRLRLEHPNQGPDLGSPLETDVVQVHEFAAGHPTQIAQAAVACA